MADPDLQGGGGGEGVIETLRKGEWGLQKIFFQLFGPHFGRKIRGGGPPGPSPGSATATLAILIPPVRLFEQAIFEDLAILLVRDTVGYSPITID